MGGSTAVTVSDSVNGYAEPYPTDVINFQRAASTPLYVQVNLTTGNDIPETALTMIQTAVLATFEGTGVALTSLERIGATIYGSSFVADLVAIGTWVRVVSVEVSKDGTTFGTTQSFTIGEIPTLLAANISMVLS